MRRLIGCLLLTALTFPATAVAAPAATVDSSYLDGLGWRTIGPFRGGRALAVTGVPGEPDHFYFGSVDGGVWESINAGRTWTPIFDSAPVGSIGAIAVAPSSVRTIYVGSGEADMRSDIAYGNGMYKSTDGGKTWSHIGLEDTRQIGKILVDPADANVVYVAALGHQYGPNAERGVFKSTDGGKTWNKVLFKDDNTGAIDLAMDPADSKTIYASLWQTRRPPWNVYPPSNGPGSGVYKSTDAGATWSQLKNGLPAQVGHVGIAVAPSNPKRVFLMVDSDAAHGGVYRSDDAGATFARTDADERLWQRGWYFGGITVDPHDPDVVYAMNTTTYRSNDAGKSFVAIKGAPGGDDYHALWIEPNDSKRMILGSDQGVVVSVDGAQTWSSWYNQPTGQMYHVAVDNAFPYRVYGAQQDSGATMAVSRSRYATINNWNFMPIDVGGESGSIAPDPKNSNLAYGGSVTAEQLDTGWELNLDPTLNYPGVVWRNTWTLPLAFSPVDKTSLYASHQRIFRTRNGGKTWQIVSPDLSRAGEGIPANLDAPALADNNGIERHGVDYAIAPSPRDANVIWAGTDDGNVWITRDGCAHWTKVTPAALTSWSKVGIIDASHFDSHAAYIAVDRHRLDDYRPYIYKTKDDGKTWTPIASGIPDGSFVNAVREDPKRAGLLYAGTEKGIYVSFDDGARWQSLQRNLPVTSIRDMAFGGNDLVVATHGRAFWIMDDISSLREMPAAASANAAFFYTPAMAYRVRPGNDEGTPLPRDEAYAANPPTGAIFDYYLPATPDAPVTLEIVARDNSVVRHWSSADKPVPVDPNTITVVPSWITPAPVLAGTAGAHRFVWNFHTGTGKNGPLAPPGTYTARMTVDGKTLTREVVIARDPRVKASDRDLVAQYELARKIEALRDAVKAARKRAQSLEHKTATREMQVEIIGVEPPDNPDDSVGSYSHDFTSFLYLDNALDYLEQSVESADAPPTPDMVSAFSKLDAIYRKTLARLTALESK